MSKELFISDFQKQSFRKQVKDLLNNKIPQNETNLYLGKTPLILKNNGCINEKLVISTKVIQKAIEIGENKHHVPIRKIVHLYKYLECPFLILKGSVPNSIVAIVKEKDDLKRELLIAIRINAYEKYMSVTRITSIYGKKGLKSYLLNHSDEVLDVYNEKKTISWLASYELQLLVLSNSQSSYNYMITKSDDKINKNK